MPSNCLTETSASAVATDADDAHVTLASGDTLSAALVVAADSRFSETRRNMGIEAQTHDFARVAIVCRMAHERPHGGVAFECFQYGGTLAVLPMPGELSSIVITVSADHAREIAAMSDTRFSDDVGERFGQRLGRMTLASERVSYPLVGVHADRFVAKRFALIGDAAVRYASGNGTRIQPRFERSVTTRARNHPGAFEQPRHRWCAGAA